MGPTSLYYDELRNQYTSLYGTLVLSRHESPFRQIWVLYKDGLVIDSDRSIADLQERNNFLCVHA